MRYITNTPWLYNLAFSLFAMMLSCNVAFAQKLKVDSDEMHNDYFARGADLVRPHIMLHGQEPRITEQKELDLKAAIEYFCAVVEYNPTNSAAYWFLGKTYQALKEYKKANEAFSISYKLRPDNADIAREYALSSIDLGMGLEAIRIAKVAIDLRPNDGGLYANLALAYLIAKQNSEALDAINKALELNPADKISQNAKKVIIDVMAGKRKQPMNGLDF